MVNPLLLDFPEEFESERLTIRAPRWGDGAQDREAIAESIEELRPWMPWAQQVPTPEEQEARDREMRLEFLARRDMRLLLFLKGTPTMVGSSGLHRINWDVPKFEIGYWVRTRFAGQGYIGEAVGAISRFAFEVLHARRIEIRVDDRNVKSWRIPERLGFQLEGILHNDARSADSQLRDTRIYALTRPDP